MKKIVSFVFVLMVAVLAFAQNVESAGITDSDCKNYGKNFDKIVELGDYYADQYIDYSLPEYASAETFLEKIGISGPNRIAKIVVINTCVGILVTEEALNADPESAALMKAMGLDPLADVKATVNAKDMATVKKNYSALSKVVEYIANDQ